MAFLAVLSFLIFRKFPAFWVLGCVALGFAACNDAPRKVYPSPKGYELAGPEVKKLPVELDEISGIAYHNEDQALFAIQDETGLLYKIQPFQKENIERWRYGISGDYEDIVLKDGKFYVLKSNGNIAVFNFDDSGKVQGAEYPMNLVQGAEFESLYYEPAAGKLVLICKDCPQDKKKTVSTYRFDPVARAFESSEMTIDAEGIAGAMGQKSVKFKPSAAAIHPISGALYIVSAVNKMLVVADRQGRTQEVYMLPPGLHKQPEGLSFAPDGTMFISNEAADVGVADILIYKYTRPDTPK